MYALYQWPKRNQGLRETMGKESPAHRKDVIDLEPHRGK